MFYIVADSNIWDSIELIKLGCRLVVLLLLLSLGLVNSAAHSLNTNIAPFSNTQTVCTDAAGHKVSFHDTSASDDTSLSPNSENCVPYEVANPSPDNTHFHDSQSLVQLNTFRRILSNDQELFSDLEPVYHLLIDFFPPSMLAYVLATVPLLDSKQHWTSTVASTPSRLSGWKEGNIQYSHYRESLS